MKTKIFIIKDCQISREYGLSPDVIFKHNNGKEISEVCAKQFKKVTGMSLKKGESKKVKVTQLKKGFKMEVI